MNRRTLAELREAVAAGPPYTPEFLEGLRSDPREGGRALYDSCVRRLSRCAGERARLDAMLAFEREAADNGFGRVAGVDEAGRGPLAGPIVAAAVVLAEPVEGLNDSKQVPAERREALCEILLSGQHAVGVFIVPPGDIDRRGIQAANYEVLVRAALCLEPPPDFLLVDGFRIPGSPIPHRRLVKGDCRSLSIAAASIVAKVTRDRIMDELDAAHPGYGFARHKGYATPEHLEALRRLGPSPVHRMSFAPIAPRQAESGDLFTCDQEGWM